MAQVIRTQVRIERDTGIPADAITNTYYNLCGTDGAVAALAAATAVQEALGTLYLALDSVLANTLAPLATFKSYTLADPEPRAPIRTATQALTLAATALPAELAVCLSYRAAPVSGVPVARTRGRVFLGPLSTAWLGSELAGDIRPNAATATSTRDVFKIFADTLEGNFPWAVFSPTSNVARQVVEVSTDDAFDIQRRRGAAPTVRTRLMVS